MSKMTTEEALLSLQSTEFGMHLALLDQLLCRFDLFRAGITFWDVS